MYQSGKWIVGTVVAVAVSLAVSVPAHAAPTFTPGNNPSNDENILFSGGTQTGTSIFGTTNQSNLSVQFSSTDVLMSMGGQADVNANSGDLTNLTISVPNGYYTDLIINPDIKNDDDDTAQSGDGGLATIIVTTNDGPFTFTGTDAQHPYDIGNGNNFLTIVAAPGEQILSTQILVDGQFDDLKQPRISGAALNTTPVTPEPASMALLVTGVLPLIGRLRRRKI
jgi:hypothetical protein